MDYQNFDLLGDPVDPNHNGKGRPSHKPTRETRRIVKALWAEKRNNSYCAAALGISEPCFNEHYFKTEAQKADRENARASIQATILKAVLNGVEEGSMTAVKTLRDILHRADMEDLSKEIAKGRDSEETPPRQLGKKDQLIAEAHDVGDIYQPPAPPMRLQ